MKKSTSRYYSFVLLLLIAFISDSKSDQCNSFPKIFGGTAESTHLCEMDIFNDYLAFGCDITDKTLLGLSTTAWIQAPYIALVSISKSAKIYWAKAFP